MRACPGDWIVIKSRTTGRPAQRGRIMEVAAGGSPPYLVRWLADDRVSLFYPGSDAIVLTPEEVSAADERERARFAAAQRIIAGRSGLGTVSGSTGP
jgi:uncharacterized protein DUF1918